MEKCGKDFTTKGNLCDHLKTKAHCEEVDKIAERLRAGRMKGAGEKEIVKCAVKELLEMAGGK